MPTMHSTRCTIHWYTSGMTSVETKQRQHAGFSCSKKRVQSSKRGVKLIAQCSTPMTYQKTQQLIPPWHLRLLRTAAIAPHIGTDSKPISPNCSTNPPWKRQWSPIPWNQRFYCVIVNRSKRKVRVKFDGAMLPGPRSRRSGKFFRVSSE